MASFLMKDDLKKILSEEISKAQTTINSLKLFMNSEEGLRLYKSYSNLNVTFHNYAKTGIRYNYRFIKTQIEDNVFDFQEKKYKTIGALLSDLKKYIKYCQRTFYKLDDTLQTGTADSLLGS